MIYPEILASPVSHLKLGSPIADHADWIVKNIYHLLYAQQKPIDGIARYYHGGSDVTRVALILPPYLELFKKYGSKEAAAINVEDEEGDYKCLLIAALFHDSGREDDNKDKWDADSAENCYLYLKNMMGVSDEKARFFANVILKKDSKDADKNIFQKLLHDADCADIIRARKSFDGKFTDFYQDVGKNNPAATRDVGLVNSKVGSLIEYMGDSFQRTNSDIKKEYEFAPNCYKKIQEDISDPKKDLSVLNPKETLHYLSEKDATPLTKMLNAGDVLVRGVGAPACIVDNQYKGTKKQETLGELETRKILREQGVPTRTEKSNRLEKEGNPDRSVSLIGFGAPVFTAAGYLIFNPKMSNLKGVSAKDMHSDRGKKINLFKHKTARGGGPAVVQAYEELKQTIQLKPKAEAAGLGEMTLDFNELNFHITKVNAVYYTQDPTFYDGHIGNYLSNNHPFNAAKPHPYRSILQAIYLRNEHYKQSGILLPLVKYSYVHNTLEEDKTVYDEKKLIEMWRDIIAQYLNYNVDFTIDQLYDPNFSIDKLKTDCITPISIHEGLQKALKISEMAPADANYPPELREKINQELSSFVQATKKKIEESAWTHLADKNLKYDETTLRMLKVLVLAKKQSPTRAQIDSLKLFINNAIETKESEVLHYVDLLDSVMQLSNKFFPKEAERIKSQIIKSGKTNAEEQLELYKRESPKSKDVVDVDAYQRRGLRLVMLLSYNEPLSEQAHVGSKDIYSDMLKKLNFEQLTELIPFYEDFPNPVAEAALRRELIDRFNDPDSFYSKNYSKNRNKNWDESERSAFFAKLQLAISFSKVDVDVQRKLIIHLWSLSEYYLRRQMLPLIKTLKIADESFITRLVERFRIPPQSTYDPKQHGSLRFDICVNTFDELQQLIPEYKYTDNQKKEIRMHLRMAMHLCLPEDYKELMSLCKLKNHPFAEGIIELCISVLSNFEENKHRMNKSDIARLVNSLPISEFVPGEAPLDEVYDNPLTHKMVGQVMKLTRSVLEGKDRISPGDLLFCINVRDNDRIKIDKGKFIQNTVALFYGRSEVRRLVGGLIQDIKSYADFLESDDRVHAFPDLITVQYGYSANIYNPKSMVLDKLYRNLMAGALDGMDEVKAVLDKFYAGKGNPKSDYTKVNSSSGRTTSLFAKIPLVSDTGLGQTTALNKVDALRNRVNEILSQAAKSAPEKPVTPNPM